MGFVGQKSSQLTVDVNIVFQNQGIRQLLLHHLLPNPAVRHGATNFSGYWVFFKLQKKFFSVEYSLFCLS